MAYRLCIIPPYLLRGIADSEANVDYVRQAASQSLSDQDAYAKVRVERMTTLSKSSGYQRQQIIPPNILQSLSQSDQSEDPQGIGGLTQKKLGPTEISKAAEFERKPSYKRLIYNANYSTDEAGLPGELVRKEGEVVVEDNAVNEAYDNIGIILNFYKNHFNWNSIDNKNMDVVSSVHFGKEYENVFWDTERMQMVFGDGGEFLTNFTSCIDVIGHELTHAIIEHISPLDYSGQSGALREHISDVFGIMIKHQVQGEMASHADWLIGEDCILPGVKGVALRSMKAPGTAYDDPRLGKDPQLESMVGYRIMPEDNSSVQLYSGIPNKAFYLVSVAFGGYSWEKAGKIWWGAMRSGKIGPKCQFKHFAEITAETAEQLFGKDAANIVRQGWAGVGVIDDESREARVLAEERLVFEKTVLGQDLSPHSSRLFQHGSQFHGSHSPELMREIQGFPRALQEALAPYLEDNTCRNRIEAKFNELGQDKRCLGENSLNFLNMLGSLEDSENDNATSGDIDSGRDDSGGDGDSGKDSGKDYRKGPGRLYSGMNGGSGNNDEPGDVGTSGSYLHGRLPHFFKWEDFKKETLAPRDDIIAARHKAILAIYEGVSIEVNALGSGVALSGIAKLVRDSLHKEDPLTFFRGTQRTILYPTSSQGVDQPDFDELEKQLFDSNKYAGYDERLTVLTYNDGGNGSISLFKLWRSPDRIRPVAVMEPVPKFVLKTFCTYIGKSRKTKVCLRNGSMFWKRGFFSQEEPFLRPVPAQTLDGNIRSVGIGQTLKGVLKQDPGCVRWESFVATIPEMIAALHLGTSLLRNIDSTPVYSTEDADAMDERCVTMLHGPSANGHLGHNARIVVLSTRIGEWATERLAWK